MKIELGLIPSLILTFTVTFLLIFCIMKLKQ
nr:MAG TPA: ATPase [Bacteriophage sp.]